MRPIVSPGASGYEDGANSPTLTVEADVDGFITPTGVTTMRMIVAIIQPTKLALVRDALQSIGVQEMTVCDAMGYGRQRGQMASFRGNEYRVDLLRKIELEIVVPEDLVEPVIETVRRTALTGSEGQIGDGKIFLIPIADIIDIADRRRSPAAL